MATLAACRASRTYWALLWYSWRKRSCSTAVLRNLLWSSSRRLAATLSEEAGVAAASGTQLSSVRTIKAHQTLRDAGVWRPGAARTCVEGPQLLQHGVVGQTQHQAGELRASGREEQGRRHFGSCVCSFVLKTTSRRFQPDGLQQLAQIWASIFRHLATNCFLP